MSHPLFSQHKRTNYYVQVAGKDFTGPWHSKADAERSAKAVRKSHPGQKVTVVAFEVKK
jgi:hypothetical protein